MAQILLFVWTRSSSLTAIAVSCLGVFCSLPCIAFISAPIIKGLSKVYAEGDAEEGGPILMLPQTILPQSPTSNHSSRIGSAEVYRNSAASQ